MLFQQVSDDFVQAFKNREIDKISVLRMLKAALANKMIENKMAKTESLADEAVIAVLKSEIKKRKDSAEIYGSAGRSDLADKENLEMEILAKYLPQQLSEEAIARLVDETIADLAAPSPAEFGKVMSLVMTRAAGQADGQTVAKIVKAKLNP